MLFSSRMQQWFGVAALCGVLGITGCSTARPPEAAMAQADLAVRQAAESKAPVYAPSEFRAAQEKAMGAQRALAAEEYERARRLAEQAVIDAQLAQARANAAEAQKNAQEIRATITALESEAILAEFKKFKQLGMTEAAVAYTLKLLAQEKQAYNNYQNNIELVWTIPDIQGIRSRDTALVVKEIFQEAKRQLLIATYVLDRPEKIRPIFSPLIQRMEEDPELHVRIILNIQRPYQSHQSITTCLREFAENFRHHLWLGNRLPEVFYDARSFTEETEYTRFCLHAKFIVADCQKIFLTSANFTEAAHQRNIEAGLIFEDKAVANKIISQVDLLINEKILVKVPL